MSIGSGTSILVVEDQRAVAGTLQMRLGGLGYDVMAIAKDGDEAIAKAEELRPDLILMDIKLGDGIDGIEAAHRIKSRMDVPVVYVSAYADRAILDRARATQPAGFINKPFTTKDLMTTINLALHREREETPAGTFAQRSNSGTRDAVVTTDVEGAVTFINQRASELTGWTRESILGEPLAPTLGLLYGLDRSQAAVIVSDVLRSQHEHELTRQTDVGLESVTDVLTPLKDAHDRSFGVALRFGAETMSAGLADLEHINHAYQFALDSIPVGIAIVDDQLKIVRTNRCGAQLLEENPHVTLARGYVIARDEATHANLESLVRNAFDSARDGELSSNKLLVIEGSTKRARLAVVVSCVPEASAAATPYAALYLFDDSAYRQTSAQALKRLYGLTRAEAKLVQSLASGFTLDEGAQRLGISVNTARTHLKHVFHKTGAKRQSELIHQIETGPATLPFELDDPD